MTLQYQTHDGDANMFALLRCNDAACTSTDVTMVDAYDDYDPSTMVPDLIYRPDSGLPVMAYQLQLGYGAADVKIAACNTEGCDDQIATTIFTPDKYGSTQFDMNMESENMLTLAFRNVDGGLVFARVAIWDLIDSNDFEAGWGFYNDGGGDCRLSDKDAAYAHSGVMTARIRDNSGVSSSFYSDPIDLSAYSQIAVSFWYQVQRFENDERFVVEFNDGVDWQVVARFVNDIDFIDDGTFYNPTVLIDSDTYDFSNAAIRFRSDASGNGDKVYIDDVTISAR